MSKVKRNRSPNYPVISLKSALTYLDKLHDFANGQHPVPMLSVFEGAWEMKKGSAYGKQVVAALKAFGLITDEGTGDGRKIRVSDDGSKIRGKHTDRPALLKKAAIAPKIHKELWGEFASGDGLPPAVTMRQYLVFDRRGNRFNEASVDDFIAEFVETIKFAEIENSTSFEPDTSKNDTDPEGSGNSEIKVGSYVQWTSGGVAQLEYPKQVVEIADDDSGGWALLEGSNTGVHMSELTLEAPVKADLSELNRIKIKTPDPFQEMPPETGVAREETKLDEGPVALTMPETLSADSVADFEYWVNGLIRKLQRRAGASQEADQRPSDSEN